MGFWSWLEERLVVRDDSHLARAECAIVIGTGVSPDGQSPSWQSLANVKRALKLLADGQVGAVMFVGGAKAAGVPNSKTEAEAMRDWALASRPDLTTYFMENRSDRTYLNADLALPVVKAQGWRRVIVVAQQWHARRVGMTFRRRWRGQKLIVGVVKGWSWYGPGSNCQKRFDHFLSFAIWDTLAFIVSKLKGYC